MKPYLAIDIKGNKVFLGYFDSVEDAIDYWCQGDGTLLQWLIKGEVMIMTLNEIPRTYLHNLGRCPNCGSMLHLSIHETTAPDFPILEYHCLQCLECAYEPL